GCLIGLIPFALVNILGHGISFRATAPQTRGGTAADLAAFVPNVLTLGTGDPTTSFVLGVQSPAWTHEAEIAFAALCALAVIAAAWRDRDARLAAASLASYILPLALMAILVLRVSSPHHWFAATPFQYLAAVLAVQSLARAGKLRTIALVIAPVLVTFLTLRAVNVVALERDFAARRASSSFDRSRTTFAQYIVDHRDDATFVAADWGFGVPIYVLSNGTFPVVEPFWSWGGEWTVERLDAYLTSPGRPVVVLLPKGTTAIASE